MTLEVTSKVIFNIDTGFLVYSYSDFFFKGQIGFARSCILKQPDESAWRYRTLNTMSNWRNEKVKKYSIKNVFSIRFCDCITILHLYSLVSMTNLKIKWQLPSSVWQKIKLWNVILNLKISKFLRIVLTIYT